MSDMDTVGGRLRTYRQLRGLTQRQLSIAANLDTMTVWRAENNKTSPTLLTLIDLAKALDVPIGAIAGTETYLPEEAA